MNCVSPPQIIEDAIGTPVADLIKLDDIALLDKNATDRNAIDSAITENTATENTATENTAQKRDNVMYITQPEPIYRTSFTHNIQNEQIQILLAESDPISCHHIQSALEAEGFCVIVAQDDREILAASATYTFDLVLLGVGTSQVDGWAICTQLRQVTDVPIIMMMARSRPDDIVRSIRLGADSHIAKPISFQELYARIQAILRRARRGNSPRNLALSSAPNTMLPLTHHQVTMPR